MFSKKTIYILLLCTVILAFVVSLGYAADSPLNDVEQLGKSIFFDTNLSINQNQACAVCHAPEVGWTGPLSEINAAGAVYEGSIPGQFGDRKPPSAAYATQSPILFNDKGTWTGGNFWDGRATGERLHNPAAEQALGPFLNPVEQALPDSACVVYRVCNSGGDYPVRFEDVWGAEACDIVWPVNVETVCATEGGSVSLSPDDRAKSDMNYDSIGLTIAAYEASDEVNAFSSKYDLSFSGKVKLNKEEQKGYALFRGKGMCHRCHTSNGQEALFTDYTFDNLGVPKNPENPVYDVNPDFVDLGLGGFLEKAGYDPDVYEPEMGKQKVPTLRNVGKGASENFVKAYTHNGYFKTLEGIVHFYNTRDVKPECPGDYTEAEALTADCWPAPEVAENVNVDELGDLGL
ncbi:MAG: cytochrome-c peroxidase, partial [Candidatus Promineifilaceae bacterium]